MGFGLIVPIALVAVLAYMIGWRPGASDRAIPRGEGDAINILRERYAKGEISSDEFERMQEQLRR